MFEYQKRVILAILMAFMVAGPLWAVEPDEILDNPVLEARARVISKLVRCVVCQNQDIDSSNAGVARDLRILVRERLTLGDTDQQVLDYLTARYGDFVLFRPPWKPSTYVLWIGPFAILFLGATVVACVIARNTGKRKTGVDKLSSEENEILDRLLATHGKDEKL